MDPQINLDPLYPNVPKAECFFATMIDITTTTCRYVRESNGRVGGPIGYQHTPGFTPPDQTRCAVLIVDGQMDAGMAFPQIIG